MVFLCIYIVLFFLLISRRLIKATSIAPFQAYFVKIFEVFVKYKIRDERNEMYITHPFSFKILNQSNCYMTSSFKAIGAHVYLS